MAYTARHGRNARIYIDTTAAGTNAVGTSTLTLLEGKNSWTINGDRDFVDTTAFQDTSKTSVAGLANANGDVEGVWNATGSGTLINTALGSSTERGFMLFPDFTNDVSRYYSGKAFFSATHAGSVTTAVTENIHFEAGPTGLAWT